jgi:hypothetical protein
MKKSFISTIIILLLASLPVKPQELDTLLDVGVCRLHFHVIKGKGIPLLFEAGGGNSGSIWNGIIKPIAEITGTTLITYDRSGLGKSDSDTSLFWISKGISALETGLKKLGYDKDIMLVAHSLGGFYSTLYASKHPQNIKTAVFVDVNHINFFTEDHLRKMLSTDTSSMQRFKDAVFMNTIDIMRTTVFPSRIPVIDIVSERTLFEGTPDAERWKNSHKDFVNGSSNREGITAYESGHYIFLFNPELVINAIVKAYVNIVDEKQSYRILKNANKYAVTAMNDLKRQQVKYMHSEDDLNSWGYDLMKKGSNEIAIKVFELNVTLHPESANTYDSLADGYEKIGNKELAIKNYKRCLELDPA